MIIVMNGWSIMGREGHNMVNLLLDIYISTLGHQRARENRSKGGKEEVSHLLGGGKKIPLTSIKI